MNPVTPTASATWIEGTGQMQYTITWQGDDRLWMSGVNQNDGTEWASQAPVEDPARFGPVTSLPEFFAWVANFNR